MRRLLLITTAAICVAVGGCAGHLSGVPAPAAGWVDFARVRAGSALGKRLDDEHATVVRSRQDELAKIGQQLAAAEKRKDKDLEAERQVATQKAQQFQAEVDQHEAQIRARLVAAVQPVAAKLAIEQHLGRVDFESHLWAAGDLTDEVIRRLDAETYHPPAAPAGSKP